MTRSSSKSSRSSGRITLHDVAKQVGVSAMTVSRALRGERRVATELAARIKQAAQELGYVPDLAARALASQKSTLVLVLVPMLTNTLFVDVIESVHNVLFEAGYQPLMGVTHYDAEQEEQLLNAYLPLRPAGLLLTGFDHTPEVQKLLARNAVPCVHMMELADAPETACVGFSQTDAGAAITQRLIDKGYRRIAFCAGQMDARVFQRASGWRSAMERHGLYDPALECLLPARTDLVLGAHMLGQLLAQPQRPDAIFFCNDDLAQGALLEAVRRGIRVPEDIAIAGFNDLPGSAQMLPPLTTVRTPRSEIGTQAAHMLLQLIRNEEPASRHMNVGFELIERQSA